MINFIDPDTKSPIQIEYENGEIIDLRPKSRLAAITEEQKQYYDQNADIYDDVANLSFQIQNENEEDVRKNFINWLDVEPHHKVLDLSCGTGKDSVGIAPKLKNGTLICADISEKMLRRCKSKVDYFDVNALYCAVHAESLPFEDNVFDRLISFGGLNVFGDSKLALSEMARVVKPGGKVLVGDESMPPWLYDTTFAKILMNNNPLFKFSVPLDKVPIEARDVLVRWIIGGVYYLIEFKVGVGEPTGQFDLKIPGKRGGTLNTRYFGKLEGVTTDLKERLVDQATKENKSIHDWLTENIELILDNKNAMD